jgi:hypothetical protein
MSLDQAIEAGFRFGWRSTRHSNLLRSAGDLLFLGGPPGRIGGCCYDIGRRGMESIVLVARLRGMSALYWAGMYAVGPLPGYGQVPSLIVGARADCWT